MFTFRTSPILIAMEFTLDICYINIKEPLGTCFVCLQACLQTLNECKFIFIFIKLAKHFYTICNIQYGYEPLCLMSYFILFYRVRYQEWQPFNQDFLVKCEFDVN